MTTTPLRWMCQMGDGPAWYLDHAPVTGPMWDPATKVTPLYALPAAGVQSTTETATGRDYSLIDAILPAEGERRDELIERVIDQDPDAWSPHGVGRLYDALRSAASSESEGNDAAA